MPRNPNIYISSDAVDPTRLGYGPRDDLKDVKAQSEQRHIERLAALPFEHRLEERFSVPITYGEGDIDYYRQEWNPLHFGLVIFIISSDQTRSPNWYRLQSELQKLGAVPSNDNAPSTLMFVHSSRSHLGFSTPVLRNILEYRHWIEYKTES
jgi:hypothetical protein